MVLSTCFVRNDAGEGIFKFSAIDGDALSTIEISFDDAIFSMGGDGSVGFATWFVSRLVAVDGFPISLALLAVPLAIVIFICLALLICKNRGRRNLRMLSKGSLFDTW